MSGRTQARACPERTCVGCRERAAKSDLLRIVAIGDECVPDPRGTLPGRGAYVHPAVVCLDQAVRRRAFPRALRSAGALDTAALRTALAVAAGATP
ncbi:YlxR family protein [Streptomyces sp. NPDC005409]|uniref:YlxR family protein n=1 Tax=unclassified Streptomyces TaxID=2593676 RepID=UPI0034553178